jgi:molecular chaperone Hsp33
MADTPNTIEDLKARLKAASRDRLDRFTLEGGLVRGSLVNGTSLVRKMRRAHQLGILETLVLGHACIGSLLMAASMKGEERLVLEIDCAGPIKGLVVEANARLEVRGYLKSVPIPIDKPLADFDLTPFFGIGLLKVSRYLRDAKQPFVGAVDLRHGNLAEDLTHYYQSSEQVNTAFNLSVQFDRQGQVTGAGGLFVQRMPTCPEDVAAAVTRTVETLPPLGRTLAEDIAVRQLIAEEFRAHRPVVQDSRRVDFYCPCSRDRFRRLLALLPAADLADLKANGPFPVELRCSYCNQTYTFRASQLPGAGPP